MKLTVVISLFTLAMGFVFGVIMYPRWQHSETNELRPVRVDAVDAQTAVRNLKRVTDEDVLTSTAELAELRFGTGAGSLYLHCHMVTPTDKRHQAKCKNLDDRMKRADAENAKHPW